MSKVRVDGAWRQPTVTRVKVDGVWRQAALIYAKVDGVWKVTTFAGPPAAPLLSYTAEGQFTITNYDPTLTYIVTGATRTGAVLSAVTDGATVKAAYTATSPQSAAATMRVAAHSRVLTGAPSNQTDTGCGPRGTLCCGGGQILNVNGSTCSSTGSLAPDQFCGGACNGNCFQLTISCYNWYWTDYTSSGFTLIGNIWGKVVPA